MHASTQPIPAASVTQWAGRIISGVAVLFLVFDGSIKVLQLAPAVEATAQLGYPAHVVLGIGILELVCLAVYLLPHTAILGAIMLTGYLGGAVATQVRVGAPTFPLVFPILIGLLLWGGLYVRDDRLRAADTLLLGRANYEGFKASGRLGRRSQRHPYQPGDSAPQYGHRQSRHLR